MDSATLFNIVSITSIVSSTAVFMSVLWIIRYWKRYNWAIFVTEATIAVTSFYFCSKIWLMSSELVPAEMLQSRVMVDISFLLISIIIVKCGFKKDYMRTIACDTHLVPKEK